MQVRRADVHTHVVAQLLTLRHGCIAGQRSVFERTTSITANVRTTCRRIEVLTIHVHRTVHDKRSIFQIGLRCAFSAIIVNRKIAIGTIVVSIHTIGIPVCLVEHMHAGIDIEYSAGFDFYNRTGMHRHWFGEAQRTSALQGDMHVRRNRQIVIRRGYTLTHHRELNSIYTGSTA